MCCMGIKHDRNITHIKDIRKHEYNLAVSDLTYLVVSTPEPGSRDIQEILGTNEPVAAQILPIKKHYSFTPLLRTHRRVIHDK